MSLAKQLSGKRFFTKRMNGKNDRGTPQNVMRSANVSYFILLIFDPNCLIKARLQNRFMITDETLETEKIPTITIQNQKHLQYVSILLYKGLSYVS
jgi:hypothetical protein